MKKTLILILAITFSSIAVYSQEGKKPKATYQVGSAKVTVWENERNGKYGKFIAKNFEVENVYKKDGQWKSTNNFDLDELLQLRAAIDKAINEEGVKIKEEEENEEKNKEP